MYTGLSKAIVFSLTLLLFTSKGLSAVGGVATSSQMHSSIVNIKFSNGACSGVVLSSDVILTAAHCKDMFGSPELAAFIQAEGPTKACDIAEVEDFSYEPNSLPILPLNVHAPDILLLKLSSPLCSVKPAKIQVQALLENDVVLQAGHGAGGGKHGQSYQVELKVIDPDLAVPLVTPTNIIEEKLLAMSPEVYLFAIPTLPLTSVCHGDSGGPTFVEKDGEMLLFGINGAILTNTELGSKCSKAYVHLITPIKPYLSWIQAKLLDWDSHKSTY